jgi:hypothetical protein
MQLFENNLKFPPSFQKVTFLGGRVVNGHRGVKVDPNATFGKH